MQDEENYKALETLAKEKDLEEALKWEYVKNNGPISVNTAFKTLFLSYLTEAGETLVSDCSFVDCQFINCKLNLSNFSASHLKNCRFIESDASESRFVQTSFKNIEMNHMNFNEAEFFHTSLKQLDFSTSEIYGISVTPESLKGIIVNEACKISYAFQEHHKSLLHLLSHISHPASEVCTLP